MLYTDIEHGRRKTPHFNITCHPVSPEAFRGGVSVTRGTRENSYQARGVWPEYQAVRNIRMASGRWFNHEDTQRRERVAVLGSQTAFELFSAIPPVGEEITLNGLRYTVVGVLQTKGQLASYSAPDNMCVFIPFETMALFRDIRYVDMIVWSPVTPAVREEAIRLIAGMAPAIKASRLDPVEALRYE